MSVKAGSFSVSGSGNQSIGGLSFLPTEIQFRMGPQTTVVDIAKISRMDGWSTAANQSYDSIFYDGTKFEQIAATGSCIRLRYNNAGTMADRVAAALVSFDTNVPGVDYGFTLNFATPNPSYQIRYIARD